MKEITRCAWVAILVFLLFLTGQAGAVGFTLTVNISGFGGVIRNPTNSIYPPGAGVTLTAVSNDPTWYFANWSGDATGAANPLVTEMDSNKVITATFQPFTTFALTLATNGQGGIALNPAGGVYVSNSTVTVTATPAAGWVFSSWTGGATGNANPLSVTVNNSISLTGTFSQLPAFDVQPQNVTNGPGGTINLSAHAVGNPPLSYQWFFNAGPLVGATNTTLAVTNLTLANAGNYWITATNSYGSATSALAALVVTNVGGSTNAVRICSEAALRAAIQAGGWVSIDCNGIFSLSNTISISNNVTLDAHSVSAVISGNNAVRLFYIAPGASLSATNLILANGSYTNSVPADGGGIYNDGGTLLLASCILTNNIALAYAAGSGLARGGAIFNRNGLVTLLGSGIFGNAASDFGLAYVYNWSAFGGGIYNTNGTIVIVGCNLGSNSCQAFGGSIPEGGSALGGGIFQASGSLLVTNSLFTSNQALGGPDLNQHNNAGPGFGGAICATSGVVIVDHSQFIGNIAKGGDGYVYSAPGFGGAVYCAASLTAESSAFSANQALAGNHEVFSPPDGQGGAVWNAGLAILNRCSIYSNYVQGAAGAIYAVVQPTPGGNGLGGGIFNTSLLKATNCTVALNSSVAGSGANSSGVRANNGNALGGGIYNSMNATSILMNVTIASNYCSANGSGFSGTNGLAAGVQIANTNGTVRLHNSLLAYGGTNGNFWGTAITDDGYNMSDDGSPTFSSGSSYNFTNPKLGTLGYYLGPTPCMALLPNSPGIDFGDNSGAPPTDQRGFVRPNGSGIDIGAFEFYSLNQSIYAGRINSFWTANGLVMTFPVNPCSIYHLQKSTNLLTWTDLETNGPITFPTNIIRTINMAGTPNFYRLWFQ